eukprot:m.70729 g.70729  ORF g.70729 m.70729 type:complete len:394 (+) comp24268_c0_seq1:64-1245(+)
MANAFDVSVRVTQPVVFVLGVLMHAILSTSGASPSSSLNLSKPRVIDVPHLTGIFVSLEDTTANWEVTQWVEDLTAMKAIGIQWFCIRATVVGSSSPPISKECPLGGFVTYYNTNVTTNCTRPANASVDTIGRVLEAAQQVGLQVHLGLGYPSKSSIPTGMNTTTYYKTLAYMNWEIAQQLWGGYHSHYGDVITGWYTDVEESNSMGWLEEMEPFVGHYLEPLARDIHGLYDTNSTTMVWASPYFVGNLTRHPASEFMSPRFYADWWGQIFAMSPHLDFIAPQDSMGAQGNSFENVTSFVTQLALTSRAEGRKIFSNVELFEVWPTSCQWNSTAGICKGRHPAPFERIKEQMANEAPLVDELIAWEWFSCLSPSLSNESAVVYKQYEAYVNGN